MPGGQRSGAGFGFGQKDVEAFYASLENLPPQEQYKRIEEFNDEFALEPTKKMYELDKEVFAYQQNRQFFEGDFVEIHGLKSRAELNGKTASVRGVAGDRLNVCITSGLSMEEMSNLNLTQPEEAAKLYQKKKEERIAVKPTNLRSTEIGLKQKQNAVAKQAVEAAVAHSVGCVSAIGQAQVNGTYFDTGLWNNCILCANIGLHHDPKNVDLFHLRGSVRHLRSMHADAVLDLYRFYVARQEGRPANKMIQDMAQRFLHYIGTLNPITGRPKASEHLYTGAFSELSEVEQQPSRRCFPAYCQDEKFLYIYGGCKGYDNVLKDLWRLDLETLEWQKIEVSNSPPRVYAALCVFDSKLWLHGGSPSRTGARSECCSDLFSVDLESLTKTSNAKWKKVDAVGDVIPPVMGHTLHVYNGSAYFFSGASGVRHVFSLQPSDAPNGRPRWIRLKVKGTKPCSRELHSSWLEGSRLIVRGGAALCFEWPAGTPEKTMMETNPSPTPPGGIPMRQAEYGWWSLDLTNASLKWKYEDPAPDSEFPLPAQSEMACCTSGRMRWTFGGYSEIWNIPFVNVNEDETFIVPGMAQFNYYQHLYCWDKGQCKMVFPSDGKCKMPKLAGSAMAAFPDGSGVVIFGGHNTFRDEENAQGRTTNVAQASASTYVCRIKKKNPLDKFFTGDRLDSVSESLNDMNMSSSSARQPVVSTKPATPDDLSYDGQMCITMAQPQAWPLAVRQYITANLEVRKQLAQKNFMLNMQYVAMLQLLTGVSDPFEVNMQHTALVIFYDANFGDVLKEKIQPEKCYFWHSKIPELEARAARNPSSTYFSQAFQNLFKIPSDKQEHYKYFCKEFEKGMREFAQDHGQPVAPQNDFMGQGLRICVMPEMPSYMFESLKATFKAQGRKVTYVEAIAQFSGFHQFVYPPGVGSVDKDMTKMALPPVMNRQMYMQMLTTVPKEADPRLQERIDKILAATTPEETHHVDFVVPGCANCKKMDWKTVLDRAPAMAQDDRFRSMTVPKLFKCAKCKKVQYCSAECQKAHWKEHKRECTSAKKSHASSSSASASAKR